MKPQNELKDILNFWLTIISVVGILGYAFVVSFAKIPEDNQNNVSLIVGILVGSLLGKIFNAALGIGPSNDTTPKAGTKSTVITNSTVVTDPNAPAPTPGQQTN